METGRRGDGETERRGGRLLLEDQARGLGLRVLHHLEQLDHVGAAPEVLKGGRNGA